MRAVLRAVRVVAALIPHPEDSSRYLVQQRLPGGSRGSLWEFPGGKVEEGESDREALIRECREELAIELWVQEKLWNTSHDYQDLHVDLILFQARIASGQPRPLKAAELRFLPPAEIKQLPFCEADVPLLEALASGTLLPIAE